MLLRGVCFSTCFRAEKDGDKGCPIQVQTDVATSPGRWDVEAANGAGDKKAGMDGVPEATVRESPKGNHAPGKAVPAWQELVESALAVDAWPVADQSMGIFGPVVLSQTCSQTPAVWELGPCCLLRDMAEKPDLQ